MNNAANIEIPFIKPPSISLYIIFKKIDKTAAINKILRILSSSLVYICINIDILFTSNFFEELFLFHYLHIFSSSPHGHSYHQSILSMIY